MAIYILKQTETIAVVKIDGLGGTINLATDLLSSTMVVQGTPKVNILYAQWTISGNLTDKIAITRNGVSIINLQQNGSAIDMSGNGGYSDNTQNASNIVVTTTGLGEVYLTLRKVSGYKSKIEPETYSHYDNTSVVGA